MDRVVGYVCCAVAALTFAACGDKTKGSNEELPEGMGAVEGRLGAPPEGGGQGLTARTSRGLTVDQLTIAFTNDNGDVATATPNPDGTVSVALPEGHYTVGIQQDPLAAVAYETRTEIEVSANATATFFLPRISMFALHEQAKVDACGSKLDIDATSGRFVVGSNIGLVVGDVDDPSFAALIYDENAFTNRAALVSVTHGGNKALVVTSEELRLYDLSGLASGAVVDCTAQDCFVRQELTNPPRFTVPQQFCDGFANGVDDERNKEGQFSEVGEAGGFGGDYSVFHDFANDVLVVQIGNWAAFVDDETGEVRRVIAEGGRFQGKHETCNRYVFTYPHDNDYMIRIVDDELRIVTEFDLKGDNIAPTVEEVFNGVDDVTAGHFVLSTGLLSSNNDLVSAVLSLDTCATNPVVSMQSAQDLFGVSESLSSGPIDVRPTRVILADSIFARDASGNFSPIAMNTKRDVDLSALSAHTNPNVAVDASASTYFVYGSHEENAGMGFVNVAAGGELLSFSMRLGTEATRLLAPAPGKGTVVAATADGRIYWVLYDAGIQPSDSIDHASLGLMHYESLHPTCSATAPCPEDGVCVPENDFVNSEGHCQPQPPDGKSFCGGLSDVACDTGYQCVGEDVVKLCVPRRGCSQSEQCAEGFICVEDLGDKRPEGHDCFVGDDGREVCCHPLEDGGWECCNEFGCEEHSEHPGLVEGPACVPSDGQFCGGMHDASCPDGDNGPRQCITGLPEMPAGVGFCERGEGESCFFEEQCGSELRCNYNSGTCEASCRTSADCRQSGGTVTCVVGDPSQGGFCDPYTELDCNDDEIGIEYQGVCTSEVPCEPWREDGNTGCESGEVCVEYHDASGANGEDGPPPGAYCKPGCATTSDCSGDDVCAVFPWNHNASLHCTSAFEENGCPCGDDEWCALDSQTCKSGAFCNEATPCPGNDVCSNETHTCAPSCQTAADCGAGEFCVSGWDGERTCRTELPDHFPNEACQCGPTEYCHQQDGQCYGATNPPCSHDNQNCANGLQCDTNRYVCIAPCGVSSDCPAGLVCAMLDEWSEDKSCRQRRAQEPSCTGSYYVYRDRCVRAPANGCFTGTGCNAGEVCDEWAPSGSVCTCVDQSSCTTCASDADCINGTSCDQGACTWDFCAGGQCGGTQICADWLGSDRPPGEYFGPVYPTEAICLMPGTHALGTSCKIHDDCSSLLCMNQVCVEGCTTTADCSSGTCAVGDSTMPNSAPFCDANACGGCAPDEVCFPWENRCSKYLPCDSNGQCGAGFECAQQDFTCRPECSSTSECGAGENCAYGWTNPPPGSPGPGAQVQMCVDTAMSQCPQCAAGESCLDNGQCSTFAPCGNNGACPSGFVCNQNMNQCQPSCNSTADCGAGQVCLMDWGSPSGPPPKFCADASATPCNAGCAANESCNQSISDCTPYEPCVNNTCPGANEVCSSNNLCIPTCQSNSDCAAGEQCQFESWQGYASCQIPPERNECACPAHLACLDSWSGQCGVVGVSCLNFSDCNTNQGDGDDYLCQDFGNERLCVCADQSSPECIDCAGDHEKCDQDTMCTASGVCETTYCDPTASQCPAGTRCTRSNFNGTDFVCIAPTDSRPNGIQCSQPSECTGGICSWQTQTCSSACVDSADCAGNCTLDWGQVYGECRAVANSNCGACGTGEVCSTNGQCEATCSVNADCASGGCEVDQGVAFGLCRPNSACSACASNQYCATDTNTCLTP